MLYISALITSFLASHLISLGIFCCETIAEYIYICVCAYICMCVCIDIDIYMYIDIDI